MRFVKCNKCDYVGPEDEFPKDRDFFQNLFVAKCPKCDNRQSPGDASMRMFGGKRPFEYADRPSAMDGADERTSAINTVIHQAGEAS